MHTNEEIFNRRAERISGKSKVLTKIVGETHAVLQFKLGTEKYGLENNYVTEVFALKDITAIPGTPAFVMGVVNRRGRIMCIINLKKLFGIRESGLTEMNRIIVLKHGANEFGLVTDAIENIRNISYTELTDTPLHIENKDKFLMGILTDGTIILNAMNLITSRKLVVE